MKKPKKKKVVAKREHQKVAHVAPPRSQEPSALRSGSFFDYMLEMYSPPDQVELRRVYNGRAGIAQDARNIRSYFRKSLGKIPVGKIPAK